MPLLFEPLQLRELTIPNRIGMSPMCMYSCHNGMITPWHLVHYGSRAVGGVGVIIVEATAVEPEGRISPADSGLWNDDQAALWKPVTSFLREQGCVPAIQLAHAGRKARLKSPYDPDPVDESDFHPPAPSPIPFSETYPSPREMNREDLNRILDCWRESTRLALSAGFQIVEIHMAHGYLLHEFLSPISNHRQDEYGGSLENRMRFPLEVARVVREEWPDELPLFVRISAIDCLESGWTLEDSFILTGELKRIGIDLIDCSTGKITPEAVCVEAPAYQVPHAESIRSQCEIPVTALGMITEFEQAEVILREGGADLIMLGRELLRTPYWAAHASVKLAGGKSWPVPYMAGKPPEAR